ncbi:hypothetical protein BgiBS90_023932 [Biomphalaria glabrata]|nr:hypothetical protein BgiBS90_023932 [Biomphalaria glabrata]
MVYKKKLHQELSLRPHFVKSNVMKKNHLGKWCTESRSCLIANSSSLITGRNVSSGLEFNVGLENAPTYKCSKCLCNSEQRLILEIQARVAFCEISLQVLPKLVFQSAIEFMSRGQL